MPKHGAFEFAWTVWFSIAFERSRTRANAKIKGVLSNYFLKFKSKPKVTIFSIFFLFSTNFHAEFYQYVQDDKLSETS